MDYWFSGMLSIMVLIILLLMGFIVVFETYNILALWIKSNWEKAKRRAKIYEKMYKLQ